MAWAQLNRGWWGTQWVTTRRKSLLLIALRESRKRQCHWNSGQGELGNWNQSGTCLVELEPWRKFSHCRRYCLGQTEGGLEPPGLCTALTSSLYTHPHMCVHTHTAQRTNLRADRHRTFSEGRLNDPQWMRQTQAPPSLTLQSNKWIVWSLVVL